MGYNPNTVYCNLAEFEKVGLATIFAFNSLEREKTKEESLVDLKLGRLGDSGKGSSQSCRDQTASLMDPFSSSAGSSKRARPPSSAGQVVSCLVDGCKADLSKCRDYHRRHKVCEMHSKTPRVTIGGHEQRFCQQCSRFHSLGEFDEGKRSCRKRLEGHNRRRRKPQPEPLPVNPGNFLPASQVATLWLRCAMPYNPMLNCAGSRFSPFSSQPMIPATSVMNSTWSGSVKSESNPTLYSSSVSSSFSNAYRGRQFPFLEVPEPPIISGASTAGHDGSSSSNNSWSDRALSLLSSSPAETPDMGLSRVIHPSQTNADRPTLSGLQFNGFAPYAASHDLGFQGQPAANMRNSNILCQDVFQSGSDGSSTSAGHQTLSFSWE